MCLSLVLLQCVAVSCRVLQYVVSYGLLTCIVAVRCWELLQLVAACVLLICVVAVCYSVLQCVVVCGSVLQYDAGCCRVL